MLTHYRSLSTSLTPTFLATARMQTHFKKKQKKTAECCVCAHISVSACISANTFVPHGHTGGSVWKQRHVLADTHMPGIFAHILSAPTPHGGKCLHFPIQYEPISACFRVEVKRSIFSPSCWLFSASHKCFSTKDTACAGV